MRVLFVAWDGPQQSYLESLFMPIFARLRRVGIETHVLQFTWAGPTHVERNRAVAGQLGVGYSAHVVTRRAGAAGLLGQIALGARQIARMANAERVDVLMPRSLLPAAMTLLGPRLPIVFDADGLMADERVELAGWSAMGLPYRILRDVEAQTLRRATAAVTRTARAKAILVDRAGADFDGDKIVVVPNGKDEQEFAPLSADRRLEIRAEHDVPADAPWVVHAGALGPQYRPDSIGRFILAVRELAPTAVLSVLTRHLEQAEGIRQIAGTAVRVSSVAADAVAPCLAAADLGLALRRPTFSQRAVCPIKVAEYLLCGLPALTEDVGDLVQQLEGRGVAQILNGAGSAELTRAAQWFVGEVCRDRDGFRERCVRRGRELFGIDRCAAGYERALRRAEAS